VLEQVAAGTLTPEEALARLRGGANGDAQVPGVLGVRRVRSVRVESALGAVRIIGDPAVHTAEVRGRHTVREEGERLVISADEAAGAFAFVRSGLPLGLGNRALPLTVRMHPDLDLDVEVDAGSLDVVDLAGHVRARVELGAVRLARTSGPFEVSVSSGSVAAGCRLTSGVSRIGCELGKVTVALERGSSVRVTAQAELGKVVLPESAGRRRGIEPTGEATIGGGAARLDLRTNAGAITVKAQS
jgi:hypothetical protein